MFMFFLLFFFFLITMGKENYLLEFLFNGTLPFSVSFFLSKSNFFFLFTVFLISSCVYKYSYGYMAMDINLKRFLWLLIFFISSMFFFLFSGSFFSTFIGWDFLGLSSLILIWFYQSHSSLKAGILTFFMNRVGDGLFIISLIFFFTESFNISINMNFFFSMSSLFLVFTSMSKSALFPFSSWLPAAMQAPTPVSSLVHSSTLITAGFFLSYRFFDLWHSSFSKFLLVVALITTFLASTTALVEMDLKKIIAYSTLSHIGFMFFLLSLGFKELSFFYMMVHAFFKAVLFMCVGSFIHSNSSNQDIRKVKMMGSSSPVVAMIFIFSSFSMSGLPYLSGFFSKDLSLDMFMKMDFSLFFYLLFLFSVLMTPLYSFRVIFFSLPEKKSWKMLQDDYKMVAPMIPLLVSASFSGSAMSWLYLGPGFFVDNSKSNFFFFMIIFLLLFWFSNFFSSKKTFFLKEMWFLSLASESLFSSFFYFLKKSKVHEDLHGYQGYLHNVFLSVQQESAKLKKVLNFFLEKPEMVVISLVMVFFFL